MGRVQRVKIYTYDGSMYRKNLNVHNLQNYKDEEQALKNEMKKHPRTTIETEEGIIQAKDIKKIEFVDDKDGIVGF
ncbi:hypothetical protein ACP3TM_13065 [Staphylococcus sp. IPLA37010]|uniref:Uncharacterized protein n=1 Tax=Staphylococcus equorum TaxID=246432 RepID=A0AAW7AFP7_9STAP|nr:hypothetical protein [Staphylococcus equorum]MDK9865689.1 hypothetical protein [Staphylococcus equorum]